MPTGPGSPEVWILGSSDYGAQVAAHFGLPYCFAHFITDGAGCAEALETYRTSYRPSERHPEPYAAVCVWALAADSQSEAEYLTGSRALARLWRDKGIYAPLPSPEEAAATPYSQIELSRIERIRARAIHGTKEVVKARLQALADELKVAEIALLSTAHDPLARRHSYRLIAEAFDLVSSGTALAAE